MREIKHETILKVCELLEIDPKDTVEIKIDLHMVMVTKCHGLIKERA